MFHVKTKKTFCYLMMGGLGLFFWEQNLLLATDLIEEKLASSPPPLSEEEKIFPQTLEEIRSDLLTNVYKGMEDAIKILSKAELKYTNATKNYNAKACFYLGSLYQSGEKTSRTDHKIARDWYLFAIGAEKEYIKAYQKLSEIYDPSAYTEDFGLPKDAAQSKEYKGLYLEKYLKKKEKIQKRIEELSKKKPNYNFKVNQRSKELLKPFSD